MPNDVESLYKRYGPMVFRRCQTILGDDEAASDAMQEVFVLILRHHGRLKDTGHSSLLYTMATNYCLSLLRGKRRQAVSHEVDLETLAAHDRSIDSVLARDAVDRILSLFDERTRTIAWLQFIDGLTLEETARAVNMSVSGIRKRLRQLKDMGRATRGEPL